MNKGLEIQEPLGNAPEIFTEIKYEISGKDGDFQLNIQAITNFDRGQKCQIIIFQKNKENVISTTVDTDDNGCIYNYPLNHLQKGEIINISLNIVNTNIIKTFVLQSPKKEIKEKIFKALLGITTTLITTILISAVIFFYGKLFSGPMETLVTILSAGFVLAVLALIFFHCKDKVRVEIVAGSIWIIFTLIILFLIVAPITVINYIPVPDENSWLFKLNPLIEWLKSNEILMGITVFIVIHIISFWKGCVVVPQNHELIVEKLGQYIGKPLASGLYFIFPWFNVCILQHLVFKGEIILGLYTTDDQGNPMLKNEVDFLDGSAQIIATAFIKIIDSKKATYGTEDILKATRGKIDSVLRGYLGTLKLNEANSQRTDLCKERILNGVKLDAQVPKESEKSTIEKQLAEWGVEITSIAVADIIISEEDKGVRRNLLLAINDAQAAVERGKGIVTIANAEAEAIITKATALAKELENLQNKGNLTPEEAAQHIQRLRFLLSLEKTGANVFLSESGSHPGFAATGAALGAGFNSTKNEE
ncbi:MAG: SPFH domain-containing protein [Patescibacteria group bacterium]